MSDPLLRWAQQRAHSGTIREYRQEIFQHCANNSEKPLSLLAAQQEITLLRSSVLNSLLDVVMRLNWSPSTFSLSVYLFDNFTHNNHIDLSKCVLVGFCCLWIASKFNENKPKAKLSGALLKRAGYPPESKDDFIKLEFNILSSLNWDLSHVSSDSLVDLILDQNDPNFSEKKLGAIFICEICLFNSQIMNNYSANDIAHSAISLTNYAWKNLRHKHIKNHKYYHLDTLILHSILNIEPAIKYKYIDSNNNFKSNQCFIISNLINLAAQFLREEQNKDKLIYWNSSNSNLSDIQKNNSSSYLETPMGSPVGLATPSTMRLSNSSNGIVNSITSTPQYLLPTPGTTPNTNNYATTSSARTSLYSTPATQQQFQQQQQQQRSLYHSRTSSVADNHYSPVVIRRSIDKNHISTDNRHIPILTRSRARRYMQIEGYLNDIPTVLLSQQLDDNQYSTNKRRKL